MIIKGTLKSHDESYFNDEVEIETLPVDISKIRVGDEVLIKLKITNKTIGGTLVSEGYALDSTEIKAHLPQPELKKVELPERLKGDWVTNSQAINTICCTIDQIIDYLQQLKEKDEK